MDLGSGNGSWELVFVPIFLYLEFDHILHELGLQVAVFHHLGGCQEVLVGEASPLVETED